MVKTLCFLFFVSLVPLYAETFSLESDQYEQATEQKDLLQEKIKALIGQNAYARHIKFIKIIFSNEEMNAKKTKLKIIMRKIATKTRSVRNEDDARVINTPIPSLAPSHSEITAPITL